MLAPTQLRALADTCRNLAIQSGVDKNKRELILLAEDYERRAALKEALLRGRGIDPNGDEALSSLNDHSDRD